MTSILPLVPSLSIGVSGKWHASIPLSSLRWGAVSEISLPRLLQFVGETLKSSFTGGPQVWEKHERPLRIIRVHGYGPNPRMEVSTLLVTKESDLFALTTSTVGCPIPSFFEYVTETRCLLTSLEESCKQSGQQSCLRPTTIPGPGTRGSERKIPYSRLFSGELMK